MSWWSEGKKALTQWSKEGLGRNTSAHSEPVWPLAGMGQISVGCLRSWWLLSWIRRIWLFSFWASIVCILSFLSIFVAVLHHVLLQKQLDLGSVFTCLLVPSFVSVVPVTCWHSLPTGVYLCEYITRSSESCLWPCRPHTLNTGLACLSDSRVNLAFSTGFRGVQSQELLTLPSFPPCSSLKAK